MEDHRWAPYTQMQNYAQKEPMIIEKAEGIYVEDSQGRRYMDGHAGLWLANIGYGRQEVVDAIYQQMSSLSWFSSFGGTANPPSLALANHLAKRLEPEGMSRFFFTSGGSESVETALKIARQYWRLKGQPLKNKLVGRKYAYHGVTFGALSVSGLYMNRRMFEPLVGNSLHVEAPYCHECPFSLQHPSCQLACADDLERRILFEGPETIAAFIAEPVQAAGGVIIPPDDYLQRVAAICKKYDVLLILDEVVTGFGRLGSAFGARYYGVKPDLMTFAKGLTSGYMPLGATATTEEIFSAFLAGPMDGLELRHGTTYSGHPGATAAALANLTILDREHLTENAATMGQVLRSGLLQLQEKYPHLIQDASALGLLGRIKLENEGTPGSVGAQFTQDVLGRGLILRAMGDVVTFSPPLCITETEMHTLLATVDDALQKMA